MTDEKLNKASTLSNKISDLQANIKTLAWAAADDFACREARLNVLGTSQSEGNADIPKEVFKAVCYICLQECKRQLAQFQNEYELL